MIVIWGSILLILAFQNDSPEKIILEHIIYDC
jgi:hypothetical protein